MAYLMTIQTRRKIWVFNLPLFKSYVNIFRKMAKINYFFQKTSEEEFGTNFTEKLDDIKEKVIFPHGDEDEFNSSTKTIKDDQDVSKFFVLQFLQTLIFFIN